VTDSRLSTWPPLPPSLYARQVPDAMPYPLGSAESRLYARGRHAIFHGVRILGLGPGDAALVPAYHHGSEVEALVRAGIEPRFYDGGESLEPDPDELAALITPQVRALHLTHYLGFPQNIVRWRRWADERGLLLIEDAAQSWLAVRDSAPVGSSGDIAIVCFYKTVGLPEGAALIARAPHEQPPLDPRIGVWQVARRHGTWFAARSAGVNVATRLLQGKGSAEPDREIHLGDPDAGPWRAVPWLLAHLCDPGIADRRRANYRLLLESLGEHVPAPFGRLPSGASPFAFPIDAGDKEALLERLAARGILALDLWATPHPAMPVARFPGAQRRRARTVGLPVHQELRPEDLERIVTALQPRARALPELRVDRRASIPETDQAWERLAERAGNLFSTPEWLSTWWRHYGSGEPIVLRLLHPGGDLAGIVPLCRSQMGAARALRFIGHGPSDELGPICDPTDAPAVARGLRRALRHGVAGEWELLFAERAVMNRGWSALLGGSVVHHESTPVLQVRGRTFAEVLAGRSANCRGQLRRRERKLRREHGLHFRLADDPARLEDDLTVLFELHAARWRGASTAFSATRQAFHREFARRALERGWLRLWLAELEGGRAIAALYGFRFAGNELYYQAGRDPAWDRYAAGFVLLSHAVKAAVDDGVSEYRFLRGDEPYKLRFADYDPGLETFVIARRRAIAEAVALSAPIAERGTARRWLGRLAGP